MQILLIHQHTYLTFNAMMNPLASTTILYYPHDYFHSISILNIISIPIPIPIQIPIPKYHRNCRIGDKHNIINPLLHMGNVPRQIYKKRFTQILLQKPQIKTPHHTALRTNIRFLPLHHHRRHIPRYTRIQISIRHQGPVGLWGRGDDCTEFGFQGYVNAVVERHEYTGESAVCGGG